MEEMDIQDGSKSGGSMVQDDGSYQEPSSPFTEFTLEELSQYNEAIKDKYVDKQKQLQQGFKNLKRELKMILNGSYNTDSSYVPN